MMTKDEIHTRYHHQKPTATAAALHDYFNSKLEKLALEIEEKIPEGRQKALAHTNLEDVRFRINAAIAQNHDKL